VKPSKTRPVAGCRRRGGDAGRAGCVGRLQAGNFAEGDAGVSQPTTSMVSSDAAPVASGLAVAIGALTTRGPFASHDIGMTPSQASQGYLASDLR
jgi:hypothetical protein